MRLKRQRQALAETEEQLKQAMEVIAAHALRDKSAQIDFDAAGKLPKK